MLTSLPAVQVILGPPRSAENLVFLSLLLSETVK